MINLRSYLCLIGLVSLLKGLIHAILKDQIYLKSYNLLDQKTKIGLGLIIIVNRPTELVAVEGFQIFPINRKYDGEGSLLLVSFSHRYLPESTS